MSNKYYLCIYDLDKIINISDNILYSDDFISIYLVEKIDKYYKIEKTIYCENLYPYSPHDIIFYDEIYNAFKLKIKDSSEHILNFNIYISLENKTSIYNRNIDKKINELYLTLVNHYNYDYDLIRDAIMSYVENKNKLDFYLN